MSRKTVNREEEFIDTVKETYLTFVEFVENPGRQGAVGLLCKLRPQAKELVKSKLFDSWRRTDKDLRRALKRMRFIMGYFDID